MYTMMGFIESLRPHKEGFTTYLVDSISQQTYGWIFEMGPLVIVHVDGYRGEKVRALKLFQREWTW